MMKCGILQVYLLASSFTDTMGQLAPLVMRLAAVSLVALVLAEPDSEVSAVTQVPARSPPPLRQTAPPRRPERRQRNRRKTTTTTTTTVDPEEEEDDIDLTTQMTTTTVDPRTFDHSK
jgi:hypothetical protein